MLITLPNWTMELEEKLDKVIQDIAIKNHIDLMMINDSLAIEDGKSSISHSLVRLYENYGVEDRIRMEEMEEEMKKWQKKKKKVKKKKGKKKKSKKVKRRKTTRRRISR